jgi:hypothetical protein
LTTGTSVYIDFTSGGAADGTYVVTVVDDDNFQVTTAASGSIAAGSTFTINGIIANHNLAYWDQRLTDRSLDIEVRGTVLSGTYSRSGTTTATITITSHGLSSGTVYIDFVSGTVSVGTPNDGSYAISNVTTNTFDVTTSASSTTSGNVMVTVDPNCSAAGGLYKWNSSQRFYEEDQASPTKILIPNVGNDTASYSYFPGFAGTSYSEGSYHYDATSNSCCTSMPSLQFNATKVFVSPIGSALGAASTNYCRALNKGASGTCGSGTTTSCVTVDGTQGTLAYGLLTPSPTSATTYNVYSSNSTSGYGCTTTATPELINIGSSLNGGSINDYVSQVQLAPLLTANNPICVELFGKGWRLPTDIEVGHINDATGITSSSFDLEYSGSSSATTPIWTSSWASVSSITTGTTYNGSYYGSTNVAAINGTYTRTSPSATVTVTTASNHGFSTGEGITIDATSGSLTDGTYVITVTGATTFTFTSGATSTTSGNCTAAHNANGHFRWSVRIDAGANQGNWATNNINTGRLVRCIYDGCVGLPIGLTASSITSTTATISWTSTGASSYYYRYRESGTSTWTTGTTGSTSVNLTGLTSAKTYEWEVNGCGSTFSGSTFTTP